MPEVQICNLSIPETDIKRLSEISLTYDGIINLKQQRISISIILLQSVGFIWIKCHSIRISTLICSKSYLTLTSNDEPTTRTWSQSCTLSKTNSTVGFGTLSPKNMISGFKGPEHFGQCGVCKRNEISLIILIFIALTLNICNNLFNKAPTRTLMKTFFVRMYMHYIKVGLRLLLDRIYS